MKHVAAVAIWMVAAAPASAQRLPQHVLPDHYDIHLSPDFTNDNFLGEESISVRFLQPSSTVTLHAAEIEFTETSITAAGATQQAAVSLDPDREMATLTVAKPLPAGPATIRIRFIGQLNDKLRGFYLSKANNRKYAVTQLEATDARRAFPSFDEPAMKATFAVSVTVDQKDTVISNGRVLSDTPGPGRGKHTLKFSTTKKMSSYLVAVAVGDWECVSGGADNIPIRICATPDKKSQLGFALEATQVTLRFLNRYYSIKYPFEKLDVLAVPDFAAGAMENTGAIFFRDRALLLDDRTASNDMRKSIMGTISHELAHQWFGNLVTMQWWDDIWLNEGFATWMERKPIADWKPEWNAAVGDARDTQGAMNLDSLRSTRAIRTRAETPDEINQLFDGIAYEKSAAVLRMMEAYVGPDTFRKGINAYLQKYSYGNATAEGFWTEIAAASGKPVDAIMSSLVLQKGLPLISVKASCTAGKTQVTLTQELLSSAWASSLTGPSPVWQLPVCFKRAGEGPASAPRLRSFELRRGSPKPLAEAAVCDILSTPAQTINLDGCHPWLFANANGLGYYRTAYESDALQALGSALQNGALSDVEQTSLLEDVWAFVRTGRENVPNYLALSSQLVKATLTPAVSTVTARINWIAEHLMEEADRPAFQAWVRALLKPAGDRLGWNPLPRDSEDRRSIRASVLNTLGDAGADQEVRREARRRVEMYLNSVGSLDPSLVTTSVNLGAIDGDLALYERYLRRSQQSPVPGEQLRFRHALALFSDPALQKRTLEYATSPAIRTQDQGPFLAALLSNRSSRDTAWAFIKAHWAAIEESIGVSFQGLPVVVRATSDFCSATAREDVSRFLESHPVRGTERSVEQALESIDTCVAIKNQQARGFSQFLRSAASTGN